MSNSKILLLILIAAFALPMQVAEARFIDPAGETDLHAPVEPAQESSKWMDLKNWAKQKVQAIKTEAVKRGWMEPEEQRQVSVEKAQKVQEQAGVAPVVTDELTSIAESYDPEEALQAAEKIRAQELFSGRSQQPQKKMERYQPELTPGQKVHLPRLNIAREPKLNRKSFKVPSFDMKKIAKDMSLKLELARELTDKDESYLAGIGTEAEQPIKTYEVEILTNKQLDELKARVLALKADVQPLATVALQDFREFTQDDKDMLSAVILVQSNNQCSASLSLLHRLLSTSHKDEALYYLARCQKELALSSESVHSALRLMDTKNPEFVAELVGIMGSDIAYEHLESYAKGLLKVVTDSSLGVMTDPKRAADVSMVLAEYGAATGRYKLGLEWSKRVPEAHPKYYKALYMQAVSEYALGQEKQSLATQEKLAQLLKSSTDQDVRTLAAMNLGRLQFQGGKFKEAQKSLLAVDKNHPLWIQSLLEMGWSQLQYGDYAGAIGNMYSIHSPFFKYVYKPESYVVRTIGYLGLCQYADAYRTLSVLEKDYRPWLAQMEKYIANNKKAKNFYATVRSYMRGQQSEEVDGLPAPVIREMARHRDFLNLQKAFNRNVDERAKLGSLDGEIRKNMARSQSLIRSTNERLAKLKQELAALGTAESKSVRTEAQIRDEMRSETQRLASYKYILEIHKRTRQLLPAYVKSGVARVNKVLDKNRVEIEKTLAKRLYKMRDGLARTLEANEFLRYEVFSGSGENIRFELAGGQKAARRVPASVMPKSKELRWSFDGEYWADEIGHYRSSLKSNCPDNTISMGR